MAARNATPPRPGPRERLLESARQLTYQQGMSVGVDAILADADVARASLYQHFKGKDELIAETLRASAGKDLARYEAALDSGGSDPRERLLAMFDEIERTTSTGRFRGCRYAAADLALAARDHPAHAQTRAYKDALHALLARELKALGHPHPASAADQLLLLIDGVLVNAVNRPDTHPARAARELARFVLDQASGRKKRVPSRRGERI